jgi:putative DNA primase/helicase
MLAMVRDKNGKPINIHRTYLECGHKTAVTAPRRLMPGTLPEGCAVRLAEHSDVLGIAEGIETALAVAQLFEVPCWAALNAGMLEKFVPPVGVRELRIFGDNDNSFRGQAAAYRLANRLAGCVETPLNIKVEIPDRVGLDWADIVLEVRRDE